MKKFFTLAINVLIPHFAGILGSFFTISSIKSWYPTLNKPFFNPPNWIFSPVWLFLYTAVGLSFYFFHKKNQYKDVKIYFIYTIHIALNAAWSILFFGIHQISIALLDLILMIATLLILMKLFSKEHKRSFYLLFPYLLWLCFALLLNYKIWILN